MMLMTTKCHVQFSSIMPLNLPLDAWEYICVTYHLTVKSQGSLLYALLLNSEVTGYGNINYIICLNYTRCHHRNCCYY